MSRKKNVVPPLTPEQQNYVTANSGLIGFTIQRDCRGLVARRNERCRSRRLEWEDAWQVGYLGLCRAARIFEPARGLKFGTIAWYQIRSAIQRAYRKQGFTPFQSLDAKGHGADGYALLDELADDAAPPTDTLDDWLRFICCPRQRLALRWWCEGWLFKEIGEHLGVSKTRIGHLVAKGLAALRQRVRKAAPVETRPLVAARFTVEEEREIREVLRRRLHLPLVRLQEILARQGIAISLSVLAKKRQRLLAKRKQEVAV